LIRKRLKLFNTAAAAVATETTKRKEERFQQDGI
jgi:hypothetical protein